MPMKCTHFAMKRMRRRRFKLYTIEDEEEWNIVEETFNTLMAEFEEEEEA